MWKQLVEFFGLRRNIVALLVAIVVIGAGEELWVRFVPKYLEALGATVFAIGVYDGLKTLLGAVYAYPGGVLTDRWGARRSLVFFTLLSALGYVVVLAVPHWAAVLAATFLFVAWSTLSLPTSFALVGSNLPADKYGMGIAVQSIVKRIPIMIGPVVGGLLMDRLGIRRGMQAALVVSILLALVAVEVQRRITASNPESRALAQPPRLRLRASFAAFPPELGRLLVSDILIRFCERIPFAWVVIYAMSQPGVGGREFGLLTTIEMATAVICFIPVAYLSDRYGRELFVVLTFIFFTAFPLFLLRAHTFPGLAAAFAVRGLKEFGEAARKALIIHHSRGPRQGQLVGAYYLARDVVVTPGALLGAWLWERAPEVNFWGAFLFGLAGTLYYVTIVTRRRQPL